MKVPSTFVLMQPATRWFAATRAEYQPGHPVQRFRCFEQQCRQRGYPDLQTQSGPFIGTVDEELWWKFCGCCHYHVAEQRQRRSFLGGYTNSTNFPVSNARQSTLAGSQSGILQKLGGTVT